MRENAKLNVGRRGAVPAAVLAAVAAMPVTAVAAPEPPAPAQQAAGQAPGSTAAQQPEPTAASAAQAVPCGDEAGLARAIRAGGKIELATDCTYTVRRRYGTTSALPPITRDTRLEGGNTVITWGGNERVRSVMRVEGRRVNIILHGVAVKGGRGVNAFRTAPGTTASITHVGLNKTIGDDIKGSMFLHELVRGIS
jgi:hypothetical protein